MIEPTKIRKGDKIYGDSSGNTAVYLGYYNFKGVDCEVAIKTLALKDYQQMMQITQEMILQTKLEGCESICKLYGYYSEGNSMCIVSERLGKDLEKYTKERYESRNYYEEVEILSMLEQVLGALLYAQDKVSTS